MAEPRYFVPDEDTREFRVFVAIDLGTTYSACSFAIGKDSDDILLASKKIPTALLLSPSKQLKAFGRRAMEMYYEMEDIERDDWFYFDRFKMKLHNDKGVQAEMKLSDVSGKELPARVVFGRSLQYFRELAIKGVSEKAMAGCHEEEIKWVLTVPAIWGDRAKEFMKKAAEEAQMDPMAVELALEPEGAAFRCRNDLHIAHQSLGSPDTLRYIVADCGGGTIDVTVHDLNVATKKIEEVHPATGGNWGGTTIDKELLHLMHRIIGEDVARRIKDSDWLRFCRDSLEEAKRKVGETRDDTMTIDLTREMLDAIRDGGGDIESSAQRVPGVRYNKKKCHLIVNMEMMKECFRDSLDHITTHVRQVMTTVGGIHCLLIVGGYAESNVLMERMEREFKSSECRVVRPPNASEAVVYGACLCGQKPTLLESRKSKLTYGVKSATAFIPGKHDPDKMLPTPSGLLCADFFNVYVTTNESVPVGHVVQKEFSPVTPNQTEFNVELYSTPNTEVMYVDEPGCSLLGCLKIFSEDTNMGLNRVIVASVNFSSTSLVFKAYMNDARGEVQKLPCEFQCL